MENVLINSGASGVDIADIDRRPQTKILVNITRYLPETVYKAKGLHHTYSKTLPKCIAR